MPKTRFLTWYRLIPLAAVLPSALSHSFTHMLLPLSFKPLYPIDYEAYVKSNPVFRIIWIRIWCALSLSLNRIGIPRPSRIRVLRD